MTNYDIQLTSHYTLKAYSIIDLARQYGRFSGSGEISMTSLVREKFQVCMLLKLPNLYQKPGQNYRRSLNWFKRQMRDGLRLKRLTGHWLDLTWTETFVVLWPNLSHFHKRSHGQLR